MGQGAGKDSVTNSRRALFVSIAGALTRLVGQQTDTIIYANEAWYRERREPEQSWRGVLRKRQPEEGPASRSSLLFELHAQDRSWAVYASGVTDKLAPFVGARVVANAKLVSLRDEGFGEELWIGTIRVAPRR